MLAYVPRMLDVWEMAEFAAGVSQDLVWVCPYPRMLCHRFSQSCSITGFSFFAVGFCLSALPVLRGDMERTQGKLLSWLSSDRCTQDLLNSYIQGWKCGQGRLRYSLNSQTVSFPPTPFMYTCVHSLKWDATLVILALHGGLCSSPTSTSKRTDVVLVGCTFLDTGTVPCSTCIGWCGNETECASLEQWTWREGEANVHFFVLSSDNILSQTQLAEWAALGKTLGTNSGKAGGFVALDSWHPSCGVTADTVLDITINLW